MDLFPSSSRLLKRHRTTSRTLYPVGLSLISQNHSLFTLTQQNHWYISKYTWPWDMQHDAIKKPLLKQWLQSATREFVLFSLISLVRLGDHVFQRHWGSFFGLGSFGVWSFRFWSTGNQKQAANESDDDEFHRLWSSKAPTDKAIHSNDSGVVGHVAEVLLTTAVQKTKGTRWLSRRTA